eukprot:3939637-Rhodomonas_salina.1
MSQSSTARLRIRLQTSGPRLFLLLLTLSQARRLCHGLTSSSERGQLLEPGLACQWFVTPLTPHLLFFTALLRDLLLHRVQRQHQVQRQPQRLRQRVRTRVRSK